MKVTRLDRRHTGHRMFAYMVEPRGRGDESFEQFQAWRVWCWETFGPSSERGYVKVIPGFVPDTDAKWCWYTEYNKFRLYFRDESAFSCFMLKWS